jgi:hypothetical protein
MENENNPVRVINLEADDSEVIIHDKKGTTVRTRSVVRIKNGHFELDIYDNAVIITDVSQNNGTRKHIEFHKLEGYSYTEPIEFDPHT